MADLSITASNVQLGTNGTKKHGIAGETITAGQSLYIDSSDDNSLKKAICTDADYCASVGVALNNAVDGQPLAYVSKGPVTLGDVLTQGLSYWLSATAGGICPEADLVSTNYAVFLGIAESTSSLVVGIINSGVVKA